VGGWCQTGVRVSELVGLHLCDVHALTQLGASTLVIYADPDYHAIRIYRSVGFSDREQHVQLERFQGQT
jgi:hypothetical protein